MDLRLTAQPRRRQCESAQTSVTVGGEDRRDRRSLSMRGYDRSLRAAWTMADLQELAAPGRDQVDLALSFRRNAGVAA